MVEEELEVGGAEPAPPEEFVRVEGEDKTIEGGCKSVFPKCTALLMARLVGVWGKSVVAIGILAGGDFPFATLVPLGAELASMESLVGVGGTLLLPAIAGEGPEIRFEGSLGRAMGMEKAFWLGGADWTDGMEWPCKPRRRVAFG